MSIFRRLIGKKPVDPVTKQVLEEQQKVSDQTLSQIETVLKEKDKLLADAINQTGVALRKPRTRKKRVDP